MKHSSIINYYQSVIFYHQIKGKPVANWSDEMLSKTCKGIKNSQKEGPDVKDPLRSKHLEKMYRKVDFSNKIMYITWVMVLFLFSTLLRVGHAVLSPHSLQRRSVKFTKKGNYICPGGPLFKIQSTKILLLPSKCEMIFVTLYKW